MGLSKEGRENSQTIRTAADSSNSRPNTGQQYTPYHNLEHIQMHHEDIREQLAG